MERDPVEIADTFRCVPLCAASKAYGRFDQPWKHEKLCPVRIAWEETRRTQERSRSD